MLATGSIGGRLTLGFGAVLAMLLGIAVLAVHFLSLGRDEVVRLGSNELVIVDAASQAQESHLRQSILVRDVVSYEDVKIQRAARKALDEESARLAKALARLQELAATTNMERQLIVQGLTEHHAPLPALIREAVQKVDDARFDEAKLLVYERVRPLQATLDKDLAALVDSVTADGRKAAEQADSRFGTALATLGALAAAALVVGAAIALAITRGVTRPLGEALGGAERLASGDLAAPIVVKTRDETGRLLAAMAHMQSSLRAMVAEIQSATDAIGAASSELSRGSMDLSQRTEEQAAALEETASSMEQLTSSVQRNSDSAANADRFTRDSAQAARDGGEAMQRVVGTMADLGVSARRITEIVATIDGIAFQTNILALNAAVEAARAGEQGRGFAVVASEVRALAQRCAAAAKDVSNLAAESRERIEHGNTQVGSAGAQIERVVDAFGRVTAIMGEISAASSEQARGILQVNTTVTQLDGVTQQNAQLVQRSVSVAGGLRREAERLGAAVKAFIIDQEKEHESGTSTHAVEVAVGDRRVGGLLRLRADA
jgi:methyl-accepting chemotaxis protein